ncbi:MAG: ATP-binding cassette domain-containing protein [Pseudomonadota bacterium]
MSVIIELDNVGITYPNGHCALEGVTAQLRTGTICGLVGVNGAGKSTLFKTIMGFFKPTTGQVKVAGEDVKCALKKNIVSYVPQTEQIDWDFPVRVKDVVLMGRYGHMGFMRRPSRTDKCCVDEALQRVGMSAYANYQIGELSGGQKKRIFVARALAQQGSIILLDEPFTGVDIRTEESLMGLFQALAKEDKLILVSTHNLGSVPSFCDDVMLINKKLLAAGPIETSFTKDNLFKTFGSMLRIHQLVAQEIHDDEDSRSVTVLTDDERPLVFYGEEGIQKITQP